MKSEVLIFLLTLTLCLCQSEGDVRIVSEHNYSSYSGRLDIFWKGKWGTFCELSKEGGDAACRQLGYWKANYVEHYSTSWHIPEANSDMPIALGSSSCGHDELHVLRCDFSADTSACTHERDIFIECDPTAIWDTYTGPFETELRIVSNSFSSTGTLEIYINEQWGNVCFSHFDQGAADSACRQLGYTNAASFNSTKTRSSSLVWLSEVQCMSQSCSCLYSCFDKPNNPASCSDNNYLTLQCTFTVSFASRMAPGSMLYCNAQFSSFSWGCIRNNTSGSNNTNIDHSGSKVPVVAIALPVVAVLLCFIFTSSIISYCANKRRIGRRQHCCFDRCCHRRPRYNFIAHPDAQI